MTADLLQNKLSLLALRHTTDLLIPVQALTSIGLLAPTFCYMQRLL